jgi:hypothetical protein
MKRVIAPLAITACLLLPSGGVALAGQPGTNAGVNCGTATGPNIPGGSAPTGGSGSAQGSPFSGGKSGSVYANAFNGSGSQATTNTHATSQYDIACANAQMP